VCGCAEANVHKPLRAGDPKGEYTLNAILGVF